MTDATNLGYKYPSGFRAGDRPECGATCRGAGLRRPRYEAGPEPASGSTRKAERSGCAGLKKVAVWFSRRQGEGQGPAWLSQEAGEEDRGAVAADQRAGRDVEQVLAPGASACS